MESSSRKVKNKSNSSVQNDVTPEADYDGLPLLKQLHFNIALKSSKIIYKGH
jgi:hypothetical protein